MSTLDDILRAYELLAQQDVPGDMVIVEMSPSEFKKHLDEYELLQYVNKRMRGDHGEARKTLRAH